MTSKALRNLRRTVVWGASEAGLSLVEATIILGVIAILSAALAPAATTILDAARFARAREDVQVIAGAIQDFIADNAEGQFLRSASTGSVGVPPNRPDTNRVDLLVSDGDIPTLGSGVSTETFWTQAVNGTTVDTLSNQLIENTPDTAGGRYRNPNDITRSSVGGQNIDFARTESSGFNAPFAWRGAYLKSPVDPDPWGNRYAVNVVFLDPSPEGTIANITAGFAFGAYPRLDVFVVSAGPDEEIDTRSAQDGAVQGDDDIIFMVSSNAK